MRKIPMRTCVVSHEKLPKQELIRVVRTPEGEIIIDDIGRANGRGAYLKKDKDIIDKARKNKCLNKHLETVVPDQIFDQLLELIGE